MYRIQIDLHDIEFIVYVVASQRSSGEQTNNVKRVMLIYGHLCTSQDNFTNYISSLF